MNYNKIFIRKTLHSSSSKFSPSSFEIRRKSSIVIYPLFSTSKSSNALWISSVLSASLKRPSSTYASSSAVNASKSHLSVRIPLSHEIMLNKRTCVDWTSDRILKHAFSYFIYLKFFGQLRNSCQQYNTSTSSCRGSKPNALITILKPTYWIVKNMENSLKPWVFWC